MSSVPGSGNVICSGAPFASPFWLTPVGFDPVFLTGTEAIPVGPAEAMTAAVESIVFLIQANVELLHALNPAIARIRISGGVGSLDGLCRKLADLSVIAAQCTKTGESRCYLMLAEN